MYIYCTSLFFLFNNQQNRPGRYRFPGGNDRFPGISASQESLINLIETLDQNEDM